MQNSLIPTASSGDRFGWFRDGPLSVEHSRLPDIRLTAGGWPEAERQLSAIQSKADIGGMVVA